jgi:Peptidase C65 Otubain
MAESGNSTDLEVNHEKFKQTQDQLNTIAAEIREEQPLTSDMMSLDELRSKAQYQVGSNFDKGVTILARDYQGVRTIRGDGNCYYRAFLYSLCEKLWKADKTEQARLQQFGEEGTRHAPALSHALSN